MKEFAPVGSLFPKLGLNFMRNFFKDAISATVLSAFIGALPAAAENITMTELDGTTWESFTTPAECIASAVKAAVPERIFLEIPEYSHDRDSYSIMAQSDIKGHFSELVVDFEPLDDPNTVVVRSLRITQEDPSYPNSIVFRTSRMAFYPHNMPSGVYEERTTIPEDVSRVTIQNGAIATYGVGTYPETSEELLERLAEDIRACDFLPPMLS